MAVNVCMGSTLVHAWYSKPLATGPYSTRVRLVAVLHHGLHHTLKVMAALVAVRSVPQFLIAMQLYHAHARHAMAFNAI